jgi:hypothetical protein
MPSPGRTWWPDDAQRTAAVTGQHSSALALGARPFVAATRSARQVSRAPEQVTLTPLDGAAAPTGSPIALPATDWSSSLSRGRGVPVGRKRKNPLLHPLRSAATCRNAGLHSGKRMIADKDEGAGSSPARPTTPGLTRGNAGPLPSPIAAVRLYRLRTAVLERIPGLLPSDDYGSSVERRPGRQVSWQLLRPQVMVAS